MEQSPELQQALGFVPSALNTTRVLGSITNEAYSASKLFTVYHRELPCKYISGKAGLPLYLCLLPPSFHPMFDMIYFLDFSVDMIWDSSEKLPPCEIVHQWWENAITERTYHDEWITEGFARFSAGFFFQLAGKTKKYLELLESERNFILSKSKSGSYIVGKVSLFSQNSRSPCSFL